MAMSGVHRNRRRGLGAVFAATAVGGVATVLLVAPGVPSADAAADPCVASEIAKTVGNVAINTGMYLDSHPQTNQVLTTAAGQPAGPQSLASLKSYFDANPQAATDLQVIQRPLTALTTKCNLPISLPQVLGLMQSVQGGLPAGLPAAVSPRAGAVGRHRRRLGRGLRCLAGRGCRGRPAPGPGRHAEPLTFLPAYTG